MENTIISYPSRAEKKNSTDFPSCIKEIVFLCLFFFLSAQLSAQTPVAPSSGSGSVGDPYEITTLNNLYWIAATDTEVSSPDRTARWAAHYIQTADIDASATSGWFSGAGWTPIGNSTTAFTGSYNGNGHSVSNIFVDRNVINIGFFGIIGESSGTDKGNISNLSLTDVDIYGDDNYIGGLAAIQEASSNVDNVHVTGSVAGNENSISGSTNVGGLIGETSGEIDNCSFSGDVKSRWFSGGLVGQLSGNINNSFSEGSLTTSKGESGGLIGVMVEGTVSSSYSTTEISSSAGFAFFVGGFVGDVEDGTINECYSTGDVLGFRGQAGGFAGRNKGQINNSYSKGNVLRSGGTSTNFGGFVGWNQFGKIINCYSTGTVEWESAPHPTDKGFAGDISTGAGYEMTGNFWDTETSGQTTTSGNATGETTANMKTESTFTDASWDFTNIWAIESGVNDGYPFFGSSVIFYSRQDGSWGTAVTWSTDACGGVAATESPSVDTNVIICDGDRVDVDSQVTSEASVTVQLNGELRVTPSGVFSAEGSISSSGDILIQSGGLFNNQTSDNPIITAERNLDTAGWTYLSSPVSGANLSVFLAPTWTQGLTANPGSGDTEFGDPNVFRWDNTFNDNEPSGWDAITDLNAMMNAGEGFLAGIFAESNFDGSTDLPHLLSVTGTEHGDFSMTTNTNNGGWTFLGNPYATSISFEVLQSGKNITDAVYVWSPGNAGGQATDPGDYTQTFESGSWASYTINSGSGFGDLTGGRIAPFQAFFVENESGNNSVQLQFNNSIKTSGNPKFLFKQAPNDNIRMELAGQGMRNSTWLSFSTDGTTDQRTSGDAWQLEPMSADYALLATEKKAGLMDIGHYPLGTELNIPLVTDVTRKGIYTLTVTDIDLNSSELYLNDLEQEVSMRLSENLSYEFTIKETSKVPADPFAKIANGPLKASADNPARFTISTVLMENENSEIPKTLALKQNYPNPFNPTTQITYELPQQSEVTLQVFDLTGRHVATLVNEQVSAGVYTVNFDGSGLSSGVYVYRLHAGNTVLTRKLTLIK